MHRTYQPEMTDAGLSFSKPAVAIDESGEARDIELVGERALTIDVDKQEIVTLMIMATHPELLLKAAPGMLSLMLKNRSLNSLKVLEHYLLCEGVSYLPVLIQLATRAMFLTFYTHNRFQFGDFFGQAGPVGDIHYGTDIFIG